MARTTDKEAKRKQIIEAALQVFARQGLSNFKMADIAIEARVGKGTLYEYFRTKEELIIGSVSQFMLEFEQHVAERIMSIEGPSEKIRKLIEASLEFCLMNEERLNALLDFYAVGIPRSGGQASLMDLSPRYQEVIGWVAAVIQEGIDCGEFRRTDTRAAASTIVAVLDGLIFQAAIGVVSIKAGGMADKLCDVFLGGLLRRDNEETGE